MESEPAGVIIRLPGAKMENKRLRKRSATFQTVRGINNILEIGRERKVKHEHSKNSRRQHSVNNNNQATQLNKNERENKSPSSSYNWCRYVDEMGENMGPNCGSSSTFKWHVKGSQGN